MVAKRRTLEEVELEIESSDDFVFLGLDPHKLSPATRKQMRDAAAAQVRYEQSDDGEKRAEILRQKDRIETMPDKTASDVEAKARLLKKLNSDLAALDPVAQSIKGEGISPKAFMAKHAENIKGGKPYLDKFFKGISRTRGEVPEAKQFWTARGQYDEARMIEHLKSNALYSSIGFGNGNSRTHRKGQ